ncbi:hypothetical protein NZNM25_16150 [Nitrosopumilus zosterae]|uniref:Uncharacterized protein n=1 Tax=Nitrosopumilus zosterae TaxID=718286 RepID=A0A2S2KT50_9ARCH|nr:hypothetical protein NZNM25_16150 [Nitrosopumilus zosterae]
MIDPTFGTFHIVLYCKIHKISMIKMSKRVTIMIDEDLDKKLRLRQAKLIQQEQTSYSYSKVLNESLRKVLK